MRRYQQRRAAAIAKPMEKQEANEVSLWLAGSLPLLALALISYFFLQSL